MVIVEAIGCKSYVLVFRGGELLGRYVYFNKIYLLNGSLLVLVSEGVL